MNTSLLRTFGLGVGSALVAMSVFPVIARAAKPLLRRVKGGAGTCCRVGDDIDEEIGDDLKDIVSEARHEMDDGEDRLGY